MHNHFDQNLNIKKLILDRRPKHIVECGTGTGELTRKLASLQEVYPFWLDVISDSPIEDLGPRVKFIHGISYKELALYEPGSIDLCIIDTDHNFWTLNRELYNLHGKMSVGGLIAMHDVETFYHSTGMALSYSNGTEYPREDIEYQGKQFGGLGDALMAFLWENRWSYKMLAYTAESQGAALIEYSPVKELTFVVQGKGAVYANAQ